MTRRASLRWPATALLLLATALALLSVGSTAAAQPPEASTPTPPPEVEGILEVHFLDVGQGDATLFMGPDFTLLIDAGRHDRDDVVPYLRQFGVDELDLLIGTHPHADHIGQFPQVLAEFPVREVWMSGDTHTTLTFERTLDTILESDADYHEPRAGEVYDIGTARLEVVNPDELTGDLHEGSLSVRIVYGDVAFLLTGDAESQTEEAMVRREHDLTAQVLQLGHHGSRTSTTDVFLDAVQPEVAIYSAGGDNQYDHPHEEMLERLAERDIPVYGTATHGTITVTTDGTTYEILLEGDASPRAPPEGEATPTPTAEPTPEAEGRCQPGQVDINSADAEELQEIIHIGPARAEDIIRLRPFSSVDGLTRVSGIGPARLADIKDQGIACVD